MEQRPKHGKMITTSSNMPRLHMAAYKGDLHTLAACVRDCEDVDATIDLPNQQQHTVVGVTPLYLAAQAGHREACALLVQAGADVLRQCCIPETGDVFGPTDIALVHFNFKAWLFLSGVKRQRLARLHSRRQQQCRSASASQPLIEQQHAYAI